MPIRAIIFDLDGTAIPNRKDGMPSKKVINAVKKAKKLIKVCAATGRSISYCRNILKALNITSPCIIAGGTQIIDVKTEKIIWKKELSKEQVQKTIDTCLSYSYQIYFSDNGTSSTAEKKIVKGPEQIIYVMYVTKKDTGKLIKELGKIPDIAFHEVTSWKKDHVDIHITHKLATKKHALEELLKIIDVKEEEVMAVGDSNNDLPLFETAGFKVAMGNATNKLKEAADYVTTSVKQDGLAKVIEDKILKISIQPLDKNIIIS